MYWSDSSSSNIWFTGIQRITRKGHLHCSECCTQALSYTAHLPSAGTSRNREIFHHCRSCQGDFECKLQYVVEISICVLFFLRHKVNHDALITTTAQDVLNRWKLLETLTLKLRKPKCCGASDQRHNFNSRRIYRMEYDFLNSPLITKMHWI